MTRIALIILAAGKSTRFPGNKLLAKVDDESMIGRVVRVALESKVDEVVVVTGHDAERIEAEVRRLRDPRLRIIFNPGYEGGQSTSVKAGVRAVMDSDAVMILPADVAFVEPQDIDAVREKFLETRAPIVVATHRGRHGHPILLSRELFPEILRISEERYGLKEVVNRHRGEVVEAEAGPYTVKDIDTPEDLEEALRSRR